jgi:hypothetical protein
MPYVTTFDTYLQIGDVPLNCGAWEHTNLQTVLSGPDVRGENLVMPGAVGVRALRRRPTETNQSIDLTVFGDKKWDGTEHTDPVAGLFANLAHLMANVVDTLATADSSRVATVLYPGGTLVASVQVLGFEINESITPWCVTASMDITVIEGRFL